MCNKSCAKDMRFVGCQKYNYRGREYNYWSTLPFNTKEQKIEKGIQLKKFPMVKYNCIIDIEDREDE